MMDLSLIRFVRYLRSVGHSRGFGIQSPFAYKMVTEVVCGRGGGGTKLERLHDRLSAYCVENGMRLSVWDLSDGEFRRDIVGEMGRDDVLLVYGLYNNEKSLVSWRMLRDDSRTGVTIDGGLAGVVFFDLKMYKRNYFVNL